MRRRRLLLSAALVLLACLFGGWTVESCYDNTNEPPVVLGGTCDGEVCASATERCKSGLNNIRYRYFSGLPDGSATMIYFGGQRTKWCWGGGSISMRHTDFPQGWTSVVGSGGVSSYVWSSSCQVGNASCLVRAEFWARLEATVPGIGITIGINEVFCVGTRIYAGGAHSRNISGGTCPGSSSMAVAGVTGLPEGAVSPALERRITELAFSRRNLRHMERTGEPLPGLLRLLKRVYRQLTPEQRTQLRKRACAALSPDAWAKRGGNPCERGA
jgi:hypothetical protein